MATTTESHPGFLRTAAQRLGVLDTTAVTFTKADAPQAAASLAYYTFFSIFPLMLLIVLIGSFFIDRQNVLQTVTRAVQSMIPVSQQFITQNLQQVLQQRTGVGIFVLVSLLWSASNMFNNLARDVNDAWPEARQRTFLQSRLIGIDMILGLGLLMILSIVLDSITNWLAASSGASGPLSITNPWTIVSGLGSWIAIFLMYLAMYRWVPTVRVAWSASIWGALAAAVGWKAATTGFAWYLASPFAHYQLVYGSLGAIVAFLFLIYIVALVTLFGAHLTAAIDHLHKLSHAQVAEAAPVVVTENGEEYMKEVNNKEPHRVPVGPRKGAVIPVTGTHEDAEEEKKKEEREQEDEADTAHRGEPVGDSVDDGDNAESSEKIRGNHDPAEDSPDDAPE